YCGDLLMDGVASAEVSLYPETVPGLELLWSRRLSGPIASSPTVASGRVYVGDWSGTEWALDAVSGAILATANLGTTTSPPCNPPTLGITSAGAVWGSLLYVAGGDDAFYALDARTLAVVWRTHLGDNPPGGGYYGWCSPAVVNGVVIQGIASDCISPFVQGQVVALDAASGRVLSVADLVPDTDLGAGVWSSPCVDLATRSVYVSTGSAPNNTTGKASSIVRLSLDGLGIVESWRPGSALGDWWDADWGSSPTLFSDGAGRALVGAGHKDGHYYAFDRMNLAAGPVWTATLANEGDVPQSGEGTLSTAAFDGHHLYVGGGVPPGNSDPAVGGSVSALDPATGAIVWRRYTAGTVVAPVSTANGVVFSTAGNLAFALDAATGNVLWSTPTAGGCYGGVAIAHGRIYFGDLAGTLYCFSIRGATP
ncbi:MAG TPA: PQQ-binding-like beta-propeller repeat protein, partial [Thermoanaerobaculia bacterium]|nr:PQQ-binding-like beta-propeller repeat protein [Thermoanaerobaculia bacterium]